MRYHGAMQACTKCARPIPSAASFCGACGAPSPGAGAASAFEEPPICGGCGVTVNAARSACEACGAPYSTPALRAAQQPGGGYWVAVRATFTCNACRFDVPLNHFELGDGVVCTRCGLEQRFDRSTWRELVDFAHEVGDLGAPGPEGRFPDPEVRLAEPKPFAEVGISAIWAVEDEYQACPGNPLCRACKAPRVVVGKRDRSVDVGCSRCSEKSTYELPPHTHLQRLAGVLADEHEAGRSEATMIEESGVVVLRCPSCSAPLSGVKDEDGVVTCGYCRVPCRISSRTHARAGHKKTPVKTWWLYFDEPSPLRRKLLNEARQDAARQAKGQVRDEQRARSVAAGQVQRAETPSRRAARKEKAAQRKALVPLLAVFATMPIFAGVIFYQSRKEESAHEPESAESAESAEKAEGAALPSDDVLRRWSFSMPREEASALFGVDAKPGAKIKLKDRGVFKEVELGGTGGPTYSIALSGGAKFDIARVLERLAKIAPNRLRQDAATQREINVGRTLLRVDPRSTPKYKARVSVMTWVEGEAGVAAADAFLAAVRYAALDGPELTPAQLRMLNGTPLSEAARFDVTMPIESAAKSFVAAFPSGNCVTRTDVLTKDTSLTCTADVDDPTIAEVRYAWPNAARTRLHSVTFLKHKGASDPVGCLETALGRGEKKVVDFASGRGELTWPLGKRGDRAVLDGAGLRLVARDGAKPEEPADWAADHAKIVGALAGCADRK